ncbi:hypothetical protein LOD99_150 [Oopsacas minuta]|uniref:CAF1B/HIR1 beta-propeller domain-containing protein n=1 Tax=Oopsacas minuta TaxID=111878 RepID=A0AAV7K8K1_9METZ|nr:hypothetical protein LOD99_150 [Oopsacas minuta]
MKFITPEIVWHSKEPVFSIDFSVQPYCYRLASAGADKDIKIWDVSLVEEKIQLKYLFSLTRHDRAVNTVRFSPDGRFLASGGDDGWIIIWNVTSDEDILGESEEKMSVHKVLRGHLEDVSDLSWSLDGCRLVSGSVDNTAILWDVERGQALFRVREHKHYVQGVAFDPIKQYIATLSSDRTLKFLNLHTGMTCVSSVSKVTAPDQSHFKAFKDETLSTFFRRLSYSPDGNILVVPSGQYKQDTEKTVDCTFIFSRNCLTKPVMYLPTLDKPSVLVRFNPRLYKLLPDATPIFKLAYRMIYAVATLCTVYLYDTQRLEPLAVIGQIHYANLTDMSWSSDGRLLVISSTDSYCTVILFSEGELGELYEIKKAQTHGSGEQILIEPDTISSGEMDTIY